MIAFNTEVCNIEKLDQDHISNFAMMILACLTTEENNLIRQKYDQLGGVKKVGYFWKFVLKNTLVSYDFNQK